MPAVMNKDVFIPKKAPGGDTRSLPEAIALVRRKFNPITMQYVGEREHNGFEAYHFKMRVVE